MCCAGGCSRRLQLKVDTERARFALSPVCAGAIGGDDAHRLSVWWQWGRFGASVMVLGYSRGLHGEIPMVDT